MINEHLHLSEKGEQLIRHFESCKLKAYADSGGVWTIGWGTTRYSNGKSVKKGDVITQEEADRLFTEQMPKYELMVKAKVKRELSQQEFDAATSFAYNAGTSYKSGNTWRDYNLWVNINNGMTGDDMFRYWTSLAVTAGGKKLNGLMRRRKAEATLYLTAILNFYAG